MAAATCMPCDEVANDCTTLVEFSREKAAWMSSGLHAIANLPWRCDGCGNPEPKAFSRVCESHRHYFGECCAKIKSKIGTTVTKRNGEAFFKCNVGCCAQAACWPAVPEPRISEMQLALRKNALDAITDARETHLRDSDRLQKSAQLLSEARAAAAAAPRAAARSRVNLGDVEDEEERAEMARDRADKRAAAKTRKRETEYNAAMLPALRAFFVRERGEVALAELESEMIPAPAPKRRRGGRAAAAAAEAPAAADDLACEEEMEVEEEAEEE